ncbi:MAG: TdeIII family type II restriction endonuclease [Endomicrobium sp.]|uniref:TdeIII family type II restriction endonuclease n=1 Tax=Candidatus Endomicrobiellum pyrsonymphae TaxID=1408203 RepID=UPI003583758B|nr:TdeIII family type II restriction endonuclease [Endomicrobium sp.]
MSLNQMQKSRVEEILKESLRTKFGNYKPEPASMPFHTRLLGKDRMALFFIHSLNTNFGTTIFEPVALELTKSNFEITSKQADAGTRISDGAQREIQNILDNISAANIKPNKIEEMERIRKVSQKGKMHKVKLTKIDVFLEKSNGEKFLFDIKTAKPNKGGFKEFKRTLLEWVVAIFAENPQAKVNTLIAIPYNPYNPKPYDRWTMAGMLDLPNELKVADEFWDFLSGKDAYKDLLDCFERVGIELRDEIDNYFKKYNNI